MLNVGLIYSLSLLSFTQLPGSKYHINAVDSQTFQSYFSFELQNAYLTYPFQCPIDISIEGIILFLPCIPQPLQATTISPVPHIGARSHP